MNIRLFQLVVRSGPTPGKIFPIMKTEVIIGRDSSADILVNDAEVSRHHAVIKFNANGYSIEDLGSTNGTVINGQRITGPHMIMGGELISLGEHISLVFEPQPVIDPDATIVSTYQVPPAMQQPNQPVSVPSAFIPVAPPISAPVSPPISQGFEPESFYLDDLPEDKPARFPTWLIVLLVVAVVITCGCLIAALSYIDSNFLWCDLVPFLPGCQLLP